MNRSKRNVLVLAALLVVWGLLVFFRTPDPVPQAGPEPRPVASTARTPRPQGGELPRLKTELLRQTESAYPAAVHDIFGAPPPPPPPPPPPTPPRPASTPPPPPPPDPFQEEARHLRYVGFLQAGNSMTAFIVRGSEVFTVEAGATFANRFKLAAVTEEALLVTTPSGEKQVRVPLAPMSPGGPPAGMPRQMPGMPRQMQ